MHTLQSINGCAIQKIWFKTKTDWKRGKSRHAGFFFEHSDRNFNDVCSNDKILTRKFEKLKLVFTSPQLLWFGTLSKGQFAAVFFKNSTAIWFLEEFQWKLKSECRREFWQNFARVLKHSSISTKQTILKQTNTVRPRSTLSLCPRKT